MPYRVQIKPLASKYIKKLPRQAQKRILDALTALGNDPYPAASTRLTNAETQYRLRVGDWRILYDVDTDVLIIDVVRVIPRGDAYKQR